MAKKSQVQVENAAEESAATPPAPVTGTSRVIGASGVFIPGPTIFKAPAQEAPKPVEQKKTDRSAPFTVVTSQHILKSLAKGALHNKLSKLTAMARKNRDIAWLLDEYKTLKTISEKQPKE